MSALALARKTARTLEHRAKSLKRFRRQHLLASTENLPIRDNAVLYESYSGNGMLCHPEAIFRQLLREPDMQHLEHIWVLKDLDRYASTIEKFRDNPKVSFVEWLSVDYYRALRTSKYLVNNVTFPQQFSKREGQIFLDTWHGVPLKKMGYDVAGRASDARNIVRNFMAADYLLSAGSSMTDQMYLGAFKLNNVFNGAIIETGNPRIDRQVPGPESESELRGWFEDLGLGWDDREIILYSPTWKGENYAKPETDASNLQAVVEHLTSKVDSAKYRVLLKAHQVVADRVAGVPAMKDFLVPNDVPTNLLLGATSLLVTDYSSVFYDFLATGRPLVFYVPDLDSYRTQRDVYTEPEDYPGELACSLPELGEVVQRALLRNGLTAQVQERYDRDASEYCSQDDGYASSRVIDIVFRGKEDGYVVNRDFSDGRETLLLYVGGMASNGITTSALNLLDNIDHDRFDVSILYPYTIDADKIRNCQLINPNVRVLVRDGTFNGSYFANRDRMNGLEEGWPLDGRHSKPVDALWQDEWTRIFGAANFDYVADFCGYAPFWDFLFLKGKAKSHAVWLHNDLAADAEREVEGKRNLKSGLQAVFTTYRDFDRLVSVSEPLSEINRQSLTQYASAEKFVSCRNSINVEKINSLAHGDRPPAGETAYDECNASLQELRLDGQSTAVEVISVLSKFFALKDLENEIQRMRHIDKFIDADPKVRTFVSVGRLSPEKNHERLIRAFSIVHEQFQDTRLIIIGDGPLRSVLDALISRLGLSHVVTMAGQQQNPYLIMAKADCFVLSSDYEGQPMVILEALTVGLPIVTTAFGSVRAALPNGAGLIVDLSAEALAEGMQGFLNGKVAAHAFDPDEYNRVVLNEFYATIGSSFQVEPMLLMHGH